MHKVLIVDDDPAHCRLAGEILEEAGFATCLAHDGAEALALLRKTPGIGAVILDLVMPEMDGMAVMEAMRREGIALPVIVQTGRSSLDAVVSAMRLGAVDFVMKPAAPERLVVSLRNAMKRESLETALRAERFRRAGTVGFGQIISKSPAMARALALGRKAAASTIPVLIEGEAGVGKELLARAIQGSGDRAGKPFVTVNCGAIPANLVDSTLFGHVKGAFTGAISDSAGKFREAHNGTLFLDEVGELAPETQEKLLRAIQEGEIEPVGGSAPQRVNVRIISATNRRLLNLARDGAFREDLYYRLNVFPIYVPPLRERREDIPALAEHFVARFAAEEGRRVQGLSREALALLAQFDWPGNIRQLGNAVFRAVALAESPLLTPGDFPQILAARDGNETARRHAAALYTPAAPVHIDEATALPRLSDPVAPAPVPGRFLDADGQLLPLETIERDLIAFAIDHYAGRMAQVARALGIGRSTLYRKLKEYGLDAAARSDVA